jgi:hypothetical protein
MKDASKVKFVSHVGVGQKNVRARKPFKVQADNSRRYIRLEISAPMSLNRIKDVFGHFWPNDDAPVVHGTVLNISAGGVLVDIDQPLNAGDIVGMRFTLQNVEVLENVLGLVKRCDNEEDCSLAGIEFLNRSSLQDRLTAGEVDLLGDKLSTFHDSVQRTLERYLYREKHSDLAEGRR